MRVEASDTELSYGLARIQSAAGGVCPASRPSVSLLLTLLQTAGQGLADVPRRPSRCSTPFRLCRKKKKKMGQIKPLAAYADVASAVLGNGPGRVKGVKRTEPHSGRLPRLDCSEPGERPWKRLSCPKELWLPVKCLNQSSVTC